MPDALFFEDHEVVPLLSQMDLDREGLLEIIRYANSERKLCTGNDSNGFEPMTVYSRAARGLRETYGDPWEYDDSNGQAGIRHPKKRLRIIPCNFDEYCGTTEPGKQPSNRSPKGEVSRRKTRCNQTGWLLGLPVPAPTISADDYATWVLGIRSVDGEPLRAELSLPIAFESNHFTLFRPRIILLQGNEDDTFGKRQDGPAPTEVVDIPVRRK